MLGPSVNHFFCFQLVTELHNHLGSVASIRVWTYRPKTFMQSIQFFATASVVIAPHGAGMVHLLHCPKVCPFGKLRFHRVCRDQCANVSLSEKPELKLKLAFSAGGAITCGHPLRSGPCSFAHNWSNQQSSVDE